MNHVQKIINSEIIYFLNENMNHDEWIELYINYESEIFHMIENKEQIKFDVIPKNQYHRALQEFIKYREFFRFPESKIFEWKDLVLSNIAKLNILTAIAGHTDHFPYDEFYDEFNNTETYKSNQYNLFTQELDDVTTGAEFDNWRKAKYKETGDKDYLMEDDWGTIYKFLDEVKHMDEYLPLFSNGQWLLSDFGLKPLEELGVEMANSDSPTEIIVLLNKILDVTHQRSDLAEIFIEGGSTSLDYITNF